jgi:hypothetical protein
MGRKSKQEYLLAIWDRYQRVGRQFKSKILDEFCLVCSYLQKYAISLLQRPPGRRHRRPGPRRRYAEAKAFQIDGSRASRFAEEPPLVPILAAAERPIRVQSAPFTLSPGEPLNPVSRIGGYGRA